MDGAIIALGLLALGLYATLFLGLLALVLYFVPSFIAAQRMERPGGVFVVNFLLGWTLIGWILALAWAVRGAHRMKPSAAPARTGPADLAPATTDR